jgi:hypothetical protein
MALKQLVPNIMAMVDFKTNKKYKTKKEKEKDITLEELVTLGKSLVEDELFGDEVQSLRDLVEEETRNSSSLKE